MAQQHTIKELSDDFSRFKKRVSEKFAHLNNTLDDMRPKVQEMHEFIIDSKGFERGKASYNKNGTINISKDVWGLIIKLVGIIAVIIGIWEVNNK